MAGLGQVQKRFLKVLWAANLIKRHGGYTQNVAGAETAAEDESGVAIVTRLSWIEMNLIGSRS